MLKGRIKYVCFPKQRFALLPRLAMAGESRLPRVTAGMLDSVEGDGGGLCGRRGVAVPAVGRIQDQSGQPADCVTHRGKSLSFPGGSRGSLSQHC